MVRAMCPTCLDDEDLEVVERRGHGSAQMRCPRCDLTWTQGVDAGTARSTPAPRDILELRRRLPSADDVEAGVAERAERLKTEFLDRVPAFEEDVADYWRRYQQIFSRNGLWECDPQVLKDFANTETGARPGNMSVFNSAWNEMGADAAAESTRKTIEHLLYGPDVTPLEDRLEELLAGTKPFAMTGFKESLLTKVLCIMQPERFLSILTYSSDRGGKREIARAVYGLELPPADRVNWTKGRLIFWSNDILRDLVGDGFENQQHAAEFLWWAKDQADERAVATRRNDW